MKKIYNQSHKNLCISSNNINRRSIKKLFSSEITPKSSKSSKKRNMGSPVINFGESIKNNRKIKNNGKTLHINKSVENIKVLKINNIPNNINTPMKVIKIISSPSITTLNNTISVNNNTINNNINLDLYRNKGSIDFTYPVNDNDVSSTSNNLLSEIINKYKNETKNRNCKISNHSQMNTNNFNIENNVTNHIMIPTKTYYGSPKNDQRKKTINNRMDEFKYNSFNINKRHAKLKNYLKKTFKEKWEAKRINNYNENMNSNINNKHNYKNNSKKKYISKNQKIISH